jgi:hypothetical protein
MAGALSLLNKREFGIRRFTIFISKMMIDDVLYPTFLFGQKSRQKNPPRMRNFNFSSRTGSPFIPEKLKFHTITPFGRERSSWTQPAAPFSIIINPINHKTSYY